MDKDTEKKVEKAEKIMTIAVWTVAAILAVIVLVTRVIIPSHRYNRAVALMENGSYREAIAAFDALDDYRDAAARAEECVALMEEGSCGEALAVFEASGDFRDLFII